MSPTLDEANLLERVGGDWKLIREIAGLFTGEYPQMLDDVALAIRGRDAEAFFRAAHKVKGAVANLSAPRATEIALELERMGMAGRFEGAAERLEELRAEVVRLEAALVALIRTHGATSA